MPDLLTVPPSPSPRLLYLAAYDLQAEQRDDRWCVWRQGRTTYTERTFEEAASKVARFLKIPTYEEWRISTGHALC